MRLLFLVGRLVSEAENPPVSLRVSSLANILLCVTYYMSSLVEEGTLGDPRRTKGSRNIRSLSREDVYSAIPRQEKESGEVEIPFRVLDCDDSSS